MLLKELEPSPSSYNIPIAIEDETSSFQTFIDKKKSVDDFAEFEKLKDTQTLRKSPSKLDCFARQEKSVLSKELGPNPTIYNIPITIEDESSSFQTFSEEKKAIANSTEFEKLEDSKSKVDYAERQDIQKARKEILELSNESETKSSSYDIPIMIDDETSSSQTFSTREPSSGQSDETQEAIH